MKEIWEEKSTTRDSNLHYDQNNNVQITIDNLQAFVPIVQDELLPKNLALHSIFSHTQWSQSLYVFSLFSKKDTSHKTLRNANENSVQKIDPRLTYITTKPQLKLV